MTRLPSPFARPGRWYRGVWHCHTTESDGVRSVDNVVAWYGDRGYDFLAITDHNRVTAGPGAPRRGGPLLVPGVEVDAGQTQIGTSFHILGIGLRAMIEIPKDAAVRHALPAQAVVDRLRAAGAAVFIAHPYWSGLVAADLVPLRNIAGIEVYNGNTDVDVAKGYSGVQWDDCLTRGRPLWGAANDDAHWRLPDYGRGWTMLRAEDGLTPESVAVALGAGSFYASTGAVLDDVTFDGETATVRIAAPGAREVRFICDHRWGARVQAAPTPLREASHTLRGRERYLRIEVVGAGGEMAWTNPLFVEQ
ncbi:MAG TPA: CehA/McbA family metallohydrolase [bacterium]|nr:CehA/McbA family metallohydrolase [bacterium]